MIGRLVDQTEQQDRLAAFRCKSGIADRTWILFDSGGWNTSTLWLRVQDPAWDTSNNLNLDSEATKLEYPDHRPGS